MKHGRVFGADLVRFVLETALHDLRLLAQCKTNPATPSVVSESIVCWLMGWAAVFGHQKHDALWGSCRVQIKYSSRGYVSCKKTSARDSWEILAWCHAPSRVPKIVLLFPSNCLAAVPMPSDTLHICDLAKHGTDRSRIRAFEFPYGTVDDLERAVRSGQIVRKPIAVEKAFDIILTDIGRKGRTRESVLLPAGSGKTSLLRCSPSRPGASNRGRALLEELEGAQLEGRYAGKTYTCAVRGGTAILGHLRGRRFGSLSAAAKAITKCSVNGRKFWKRCA